MALATERLTHLYANKYEFTQSHSYMVIAASAHMQTNNNIFKSLIFPRDATKVCVRCGKIFPHYTQALNTQHPTFHINLHLLYIYLFVRLINFKHIRCWCCGQSVCGRREKENATALASHILSIL